MCQEELLPSEPETPSAPETPSEPETSPEIEEPVDAADVAQEPPKATIWPDLLIGLTILLIALGIRLVYVVQLQENPLFAHPVMDERYHDDWAWQIAQGETFVEGPYFRAPLYPVFLAGVFRIFGHSFLAPRLVQAGVGSLSCLLLFILGRVVFGRFVGTIAGLAAATYWMLIYFDGELLIPNLIVMLDLLLVLLLMLASRSRRKTLFLLAGVALGLSAIARPNVLLFAPAVALWIVVRERRFPAGAIARAALLTLGCLAVVLPVTARNYVVGHDSVLIASQGGVNFFIGNNPRSDGRTAIVPGTPSGWWEGYHATVRRAELARGRALKPSEVSRYYFEEASRFIRSQPRRFWGLLTLKLRLFWTRYEVSNNKGIYFWTERFTPIIQFLPLGFAVIGPLGLLGLVHCWRRPVELFPIWGFVAIYMVSVVLFFCTARYRMPVVPLLILLSALAISRTAHHILRRRWLSFIASGLALAPAIWLVHAYPEASSFRNDAFSYVRLGTTYDEAEETDLAMEAYHKAIDLQPHYVTAHFNLGVMLRRLERIDEASAEFRKVLDSAPYRLMGETDDLFADAHFYLGNAYYDNKDLADAERHYRSALALDNTVRSGQIRYNLAVVLHDLDRDDEARQAFDKAVSPLRKEAQKDPNDAEMQYALGRSLFEVNRLTEAVAPLRRALQLEPENTQTINHFSRALIATGRYKEAINLLSRSTHLPETFIRNRLALLLSSVPDKNLRDGWRALRLARVLCPSPPRCPPRYLDTLGAVMAELNRLDQAKRFARRAVQILARSSRPDDRALLVEVRARLAGYEQGRPYRISE